MPRRFRFAPSATPRGPVAALAVVVLVAVPVGALAVAPGTIEPYAWGLGAEPDPRLEAGAARPGAHAAPAAGDTARRDSHAVPGDAWPVLDAARFDASEWASIPDAQRATVRFTVPAGTEAYTVRMGPSGLLAGGASLAPAVLAPPLGPDSAGLPGAELALCTPTQSGLHYTTILEKQETCPFTWHDGPIHETVLTCAVAGDCTIAGQDAPTGGTFWVICFGRSASTHAWGVLPELDVQCESGSIGPSPHTWTRWNSWCRVFGIGSGTAACGHHYG